MSMDRHRKISRPENRGTVLLLAVLIMSAVVTTSIGLGSLIMNSLAQVRAIDNSIISFYAAESGVEEALYRARRREELPAAVTVPETLSNNAAWTRSVSDKESVIYATLPQDQFLELDLYDPSDETSAGGIAKVTVNWTDSVGASIRVTAIPWTPMANFVWDQNAVTYTYTGGSAAISLDPAKAYKLRLRAQHATLTDVRIAAFDLSDVQLELPGRVKIDAQGEYGGVRQVLSVTLPRKTPLSSLYDFVIFSECSLVKGGSISCP